MDKIPILLYHNISTETEKKRGSFAVGIEEFEQQMEYLHRNGFVAVSLAKWMAEIEYWKGEELKEGGRELTVGKTGMKDEGRGTKDGKKLRDMRKKVVLTFDDGNLSDYNVAYPVLKEFGFSATFFVTINEIGKENRMDWSMVYELSRNSMDIGSHGMIHTFLTAYNNYTLLNELIMSKQILEKYTRKRVDYLSIPQGFYNKGVLNIAKDVGFKAVCVSDAGYNAPFDGGLFLLKRFPMRHNYNLKCFRSIVFGKPSISVVVSENIRTQLRNILGYQVYDRLRSMRYRKKAE